MKKYSPSKTLKQLGIKEIDNAFWKKVQEENQIAALHKKEEKQNRGIRDGKA